MIVQFAFSDVLLPEIVRLTTADVAFVFVGVMSGEPVLSRPRVRPRELASTKLEPSSLGDRSSTLDALSLSAAAFRSSSSFSFFFCFSASTIAVLREPVLLACVPLPFWFELTNEKKNYKNYSSNPDIFSLIFNGAFISKYIPQPPKRSGHKLRIRLLIRHKTCFEACC